MVFIREREKGERKFPNFAQPKLSITLIIDFERYWCLFKLSLNSLVNALTGAVVTEQVPINTNYI